MKNKEKWTPSKFVYKKGRLVGSRDTNEIGVGSRLISDLTARFYENHIKDHCRGRLIDLGCGKVPLYMVYKDYVTENICVDWGNSAHENKYLDFECDLTKNLPFGDGEFNTVLLSDVLEHIPNPEHMWKELNRILARDGKVLLNTPFFYWLHEAPYDYYRYTEYALRHLAVSNGFKVTILQPMGGFPEILADMLAKQMMASIPFIGKTLAVAVQYLTMAFINTRLGKKRSKRTSRVFPIGYFMVAEKIEL